MLVLRNCIFDYDLFTGPKFSKITNAAQQFEIEYVNVILQKMGSFSHLVYFALI